MKLCILCEDAHIEEARQRSLVSLPIAHTERKQAFMRAKGIDPETATHLTIPVSTTGELPATHWFCFVTVNEETYQKMLETQVRTIIEEAVPSEFLAKHGLQRIKSNSSTF